VSCKECGQGLSDSWLFCPFCGLRIPKVETKSQESESESKERKIAERFILLANDYKELTGHSLDQNVLKAFIAHPASASLSVVESPRRLQAGRSCRKNLGGGKYSLDLALWLEAVYEVQGSESQTRVWITYRGTKYHSSRDCKGMIGGQDYARSKGKDTYNPEFIPIRRAAFILGLAPCLVCKPARYEER